MSPRAPRSSCSALRVSASASSWSMPSSSATPPGPSEKPKATTAADRSAGGSAARASYRRATSSSSDTPSEARTLSAMVPGAIGRSRGGSCRSEGTNQGMPGGARRHAVAMLDHLSIQCVDLGASAAFYDAVLPAVGGGRIVDFGDVMGYGVDDMPDFWIGRQSTGDGFRETHIAFAAADRGAVDAFFAAAVAAGAEVLHEPRVWPEYHPNYYGAFVRDPDRNNVEAVCHRPA